MQKSSCKRIFAGPALRCVIYTVPQPERCEPPKARQSSRFPLNVQNSHRVTARAIRTARSPQKAPTPRCSKLAPRHSEKHPSRPKSAEGSLAALFKIRTAPQRERSEPPKACRGLPCNDVHNSHRPTARALRATQSLQRAPLQRCSKFTPRHSESDPRHPKSAEDSLAAIARATRATQSPLPSWPKQPLRREVGIREPFSPHHCVGYF